MPQLPSPRRSAAQQRSSEPHREEFFRQVIHGLESPEKQLPCKYFYDQRGSELFDQICELDEYYLTRTELGIMRRDAAEMARWIGSPVTLIEYGSGSSQKTKILLQHLAGPVIYVPVDVSREHLEATARRLQREFPTVRVRPVAGDFTRPFELSTEASSARRVVYFPGSTIGNFPPHDAQQLLRNIARQCGPGGGLLIGIDLVKAREVLEAAYNDAQQVTAAFNLNLLERINRELHADFDLQQFAHVARYNAEKSRVEMYLVSQRPQTVTIGSKRFEFAAGEAICTELSHKYDAERFIAMAAQVGWKLQQRWTDERRYFAVLMFQYEPTVSS